MVSWAILTGIFYAEHQQVSCLLFFNNRSTFCDDVDSILLEEVEEVVQYLE